MSGEKIEVRKSKIEGLGVFAVREIRKGETVISWKPKLLSDKEVEGLPDRERERYLYVEGDKTFLQQVPERYVNHSCEPNTRVVDRADVAIRDIHVGEEITSSYLGMDDFVCSCGAPDCRKTA